MDCLKVISSSLILHRMYFLTHIVDQQENPITVLALLVIYLQVARGGGEGERKGLRWKRLTERTLRRISFPTT